MTLLHVGVEVAAQRLPPQARVDEVGPLAVELGLELVLVDRADEPLELLVGGQQDRRGRRLVDVAHLQPDDAVLDVVDDPDAVAGADLGRRFDQLHEPQALAVQRDGHAALELELDHLGLVGRLARGGVTSWKTSSSGAWSRSSIQRPSEERPQRLSSIEYGAASVSAA